MVQLSVIRRFGSDRSPAHPSALHAFIRPVGCTHSAVPSAQFSRFQIGTSCLMVSISQRPAAKASSRCGVLTATATLISPGSQVSEAMHDAALDNRPPPPGFGFQLRKFRWAISG